MRGPTWLKQVAIYTTPPSIKKGNVKRSSPHHRRHGGLHQYFHNRHGKLKEAETRKLAGGAIDDVVSATIYGQLVSWTNEYAGPGVATNLPSPVAVNDEVAIVSAIDISTPLYAQSVAPSPTPAVSKQAPSSSTGISSNTAASSPPSSGSWTRQA